MQISNPLKRNSPEESRNEDRIEPTIGGKPSPWDVRPEAAPAFSMVDDTEQEEVTLPIGKDIPVVGDAAQEDIPVPQEPLSEIASFEEEQSQIREEPWLADDVPAVGPDPVIPEVSGEEKGIAPLAAQTSEDVPSRQQTAPEEKKKGGILSFLKKKKEGEPERVLTEEQLDMRQKTRNRLVGAAALLMTVIVVSSFLFDDGRTVDPGESVSTEIPAIPEETADFNEGSATVAITPPPKKQLAENTVSEVRDSAEKPAVKQESKAQPKKSEPDRIEKALAKAEKKASPAAAPNGSGYYVQVVVTSSERKADGMVADLNALGVHAYKTPHKTKAGMLWRVRIGLFKNKKEAEGVIGVLALNGYTGKHIIGKQ